MIGGGGRVSSGARRGIGGRVAAATVCALLLAALVLGLSAGAMAATCGGSIPCQCGDTVGSNYLMTADLGPVSAAFRRGHGGAAGPARRHPRLPGPQHHGARRPSEGFLRHPGGDELRGEQYDGEALRRLAILVGHPRGQRDRRPHRLEPPPRQRLEVADGERHRLRPRRRQLVGRDGPEQPHHRQRQRGLSSLQLLRRRRRRQCLPRTTAASSSTSSTPTTT